MRFLYTTKGGAATWYCLPCLLAESNGILVNIFLNKIIIQNKEKGGGKIDALTVIAFKAS